MHEANRKKFYYTFRYVTLRYATLQDGLLGHSWDKIGLETSSCPRSQSILGADNSFPNIGF